MPAFSIKNCAIPSANSIPDRYRLLASPNRIPHGRNLGRSVVGSITTASDDGYSLQLLILGYERRYILALGAMFTANRYQIVAPHHPIAAQMIDRITQP